MSQPTTTIDPHQPVSNLAGVAAPHEALLSVPTLGQVPVVADPHDGVEAIGSLSLESSVEVTAPDVVLPDIGRASFADPAVTLETVHGIDDRRRVQPTDRYPWSATASLMMTARDGSQWVGTAWFVSPRTLVTAGHCVYITDSGVPGRDGFVRKIEVMPGRDGTTLPFGAVTSTEFWTVQGWVDGGDENYDYGAIILPTPLGDTVGTFGFGVLDDDELDGAVLNIAGYPGDKPAGTLWFDSHLVAQAGPTKVHYDIDTVGGQSGAAVYVINDDQQRVAVAVHAYGGATTNSGTRISPPVFRNLDAWKR
jgi:glutamyl endopeptidase